MINKALLEPLEEYRLMQPLVKLPIEIDTPELHEISELRILRLLSKLNLLKASVRNSSTTQALIHMIHRWAQGTDGNGATVRATLYDYRKAFDLIDHDILVRKLTVLDIPKQIINWIIDFLSGRSQRIKLAKGCFSEWESVLSGVPQGTKLGPWLFLVLINDLEARSGMNAEMWKYVDDTRTSEVVIKGKASIS